MSQAGEAEHPYTDGNVMLEVQRSLGRIEGQNKQILDTFISHKEDDKVAFAIINKAFEVRDSNIAALGKKIAILQSERDQAMTAGKVILSLLTAAATFVGAAVIAAWSGWISLKFK